MKQTAEKPMIHSRPRRERTVEIALAISAK